MFDLSTKTNFSLGAPVSDVYDMDVCYLDSTHVVISWNLGTTLVVEAGIISGATISWGASFKTISSRRYGKLTALDSTHFAIVYQDSLTNIYCKAGSISGNAVTLGAECDLGIDGDSRKTDISSPNSTTFVVAYTDNADSDHGKMIPCTVSGVTVTSYPASIVEFYAGSTTAYCMTLMFLDSSRYFVYFDGADGYKKVNTGTISGTTITVGSTSNVGVSGVRTIDHGYMAKLSSTKTIVMMYFGNHIYTYTVTYSGSFTIGAEQDIVSDSSGDLNAQYITTLDSTYIAVVYQQLTTDYFVVKLGKVSGATVTMTTTQTLNTTQPGAAAIVAPSSSVLVPIYNDPSSSGYSFIDIYPISASVSTYGVSTITDVAMTGWGLLNNVGYASCTRRGFCYKVYDGTDPTTADSVVYDDGTFSAGYYSKAITGLTANTKYSFRAYVVNSEGTSYGTARFDQYTNGITDPANVYADDASYATCHATNGNLKVKLSKDTGANWSTELTKTFAAGETTETYGDGTTELWGLSWTGADLNSATAFTLRITVDNEVQSRWTFAGFGFALGAGIVITGIKVEVKAKYTGGIMSINHIKITAYYGSSTIPIVAGSICFASNGRKNGEGAGVGTGVVVDFDGGNWYRQSDDTVVAA